MLQCLLVDAWHTRRIFLSYFVARFNFESLKIVELLENTIQRSLVIGLNSVWPVWLVIILIESHSRRSDLQSLLYRLERVSFSLINFPQTTVIAFFFEKNCTDNCKLCKILHVKSTKETKNYKSYNSLKKISDRFNCQSEFSNVDFKSIASTSPSISSYLTNLA